MKLRIRSWILFAVVASSFVYAGIAKIADPEHFLSALLTYEVFPYKLAVLIALVVPWLELVLAAGLLSGFLRQGSVFLTGLIFTIFIVLVAQSWMRGLSIDCGCYGSNVLSSNADYLLKIGQNASLLLVLWFATYLDSKSSRRIVQSK